MNVKYLFPKFYIKAVGGSYSITHRLTHTYMESVETEKELKKRIRYYNKLDDKELWVMLIDKHRIILPKKNINGLVTESHEEEMFKKAWAMYTDKFYTSNKLLHKKCEEVPFDLLNEITRERYNKSRKESLAREEERREAEEALKEETKQLAKVKKEKKQPETKGKLGSEQSLKRLKKKKKKGIKKLKITKGKKVIDVIDSDDPFA